MSAPRLTNSDVAELTAWRRLLHRTPEVSGEEAGTARLVAEALVPGAPDRVLTGLGGHGVAAVFDGAEPGPTVLFRCELDALPIEETGTPAHRSEVPGTAHLCGHDGHMAILTGLARVLARHRPAKGRVVLLYQPAEETGAGAAAVIADPRWGEIAPDYAFAIHNWPGVRVGRALLCAGVVNCASRGMRIRFAGRTSHASEPEKGVSPMPALAALMPGLAALSRPESDADFALVTITHCRMGAAAFGIAPGEGELWVTLRTRTDAGMAALVQAAEAQVRTAAEAAGLATEIDYHDIFRHCENAPEATAILVRVLDANAIAQSRDGLPERASEDFGLFGANAVSAMVFLGVGEETAPLHAPDYDFPDALIPLGTAVFVSVVEDVLGF